MRLVIYVGWAALGLYWLVAAGWAKAGSRPGRRPFPGVFLLAAFVLVRILRVGDLTVHSTVVRVIGVAVFLSGLGVCVWARIYLGRNWGMPMTRKEEEPELVTSGPYRFIRHPIYSGLLLAVLGTALTISLYALLVGVLMSGYFVYSARVEERLMTELFPADYPGYRIRTKMLIPFVL
ncbi:MAG TPA: isoprenylcysteine carboxylmethyltransferase family protein [Solirubrobacteraceae bacterium]|nr:isoprenylcysteine carboxylmethyltransferase family protein [Solirubrobacteraceae bacterium]